MNQSRRDFLKGLAVAATVASLPVSLGEAKTRTVEIDTEDGWTAIPMDYLKPGDIFRVKENGKVVLPITRAAGTSYLESPGIWGVQVYEDKV